MLELYSRQADRGVQAAAAAQTLWIDLLDPTEEERARVEREFGVRVPSRGELEEIESSSRLRVEHERLYLSMPLPVEDERTGPSQAPLGFILSPELLTTVRFSEVHAFDGLRARFTQDDRPADSQSAFAALAEAMVDVAADALEMASGDLAAVSREVFTRTRVPGRRRPKWLSRRLRQMLTSVGAAGDKLSQIRESLLGLARIIGFVSETARDWLHPDTHGRLEKVRADLASLADFEAHLSSKTQFLLDAILGFISIEQNDTFKVLTIVSVVGIPPTLIASMYGMNFHNMPELTWRWGYEYGLGVIALSTLVPIAWFKWRGWW